jgi:hypothetical protein
MWLTMGLDRVFLRGVGGLLLGTFALLFAAPRLSAQTTPGSPPPPPRPSVSPYLNLLRRDQPRALNYYNLVRPQVETRAALGRLEGQITANQEATADLERGEPLRATGHATGFMTHTRYFQNLGVRAGSRGPSTSASTLVRPSSRPGR